MQFIVDEKDFRSFTDATRREILERFGLPLPGEGTILTHQDGASPTQGTGRKIDMTNRVNLTPAEVSRWMEAAQEPTQRGLRVIAEKGPIVRSQTLIDAGITNLRHFQSRTTVRTRTITGDKTAFLLGWDRWNNLPLGEGQYAVTKTTFDSLRKFFNLGET